MSDNHGETPRGIAENINRRKILKTTSSLAAIGGAGLGTSSTVSASELDVCTGDKDLSEKSFEWEKPYKGTHYDCDETLADEFRMKIAANLLYRGSPYSPTSNRYFHQFDVANHTVNQSAGECESTDWTADRQVNRIFHTFRNHSTDTTNQSVSTGSDVIANPAPETGNADKRALNLAYTAFVNGIGAINWAAGTGLSLASALAETEYEDLNSDNVVEYDIEFSGSSPCATSNIFHVFRSEPEEKYANFRYIQTVRAAESTRYHEAQVWWDIELTDDEVVVQGSDDTVSTSTTTQDSEKIGNDQPTTPEIGDVVQSAEGKQLQVEAVSQDTAQFSGGTAERITPQDRRVSPTVRKELYEEGVSEDSDLVYRALPANVTRTKVVGETVSRK